MKKLFRHIKKRLSHKHRYVVSGFVKLEDGTFMVRQKCTICGKIRYK